jgi:hypothetical protein
MLVPKRRYFFGLSVSSALFVLPLSSCDSGTINQDGAGGSTFTVAGTRAIAGSAGQTVVAAGGQSFGVGGSGGSAPNTSTGGGYSAGGVVNAGGSGATGGMAPPCTDIQLPDPEHANEPCSIWPEYDAGKPAGAAKDCDAAWLTGKNYCLKSCGKCTDGSGSGGAGGGSAGGFSTGLGPGPTLPDVPTSNKVMWASRYWDCCKPHCSTNGNIKSCGSDGVSQNGSGSACSGGQAYTCYSQAPRAIGDNVSYGHVAVPNPQCGKCYNIQFTGTGQHNMNDPGSKTLAGKHMIVQVTNTGGDVAGNQFDLMIPGGGVGQNPNTCPSQWKVSSGDLGPAQGGFLTGCTGGYAAKKECVRQKCMLLPDGDLRKGCIWFVDWYGAADNPQFRYQDIQCPSDI